MTTHEFEQIVYQYKPDDRLQARLEHRVMTQPATRYTRKIVPVAVFGAVIAATVIFALLMPQANAPDPGNLLPGSLPSMSTFEPSPSPGIYSSAWSSPSPFDLPDTSLFPVPHVSPEQRRVITRDMLAEHNFAANNPHPSPSDSIPMSGLVIRRFDLYHMMEVERGDKVFFEVEIFLFANGTGQNPEPAYVQGELERLRGLGFELEVAQTASGNAYLTGYLAYIEAESFPAMPDCGYSIDLKH